jgi:hypothetical protein
MDGLVAMYVVNCLPQRFADAVLSLGEDDSLHQRLPRGDGLKGGRRPARVVEALPAAALLLDVPPRTALVCVESVTWDAGERH